MPKNWEMDIKWLNDYKSTWSVLWDIWLFSKVFYDKLKSWDFAKKAFSKQWAEVLTDAVIDSAKQVGKSWVMTTSAVAKLPWHTTQFASDVMDLPNIASNYLTNKITWRDDPLRSERNQKVQNVANAYTEWIQWYADVALDALWPAESDKLMQLFADLSAWFGLPASFFWRLGKLGKAKNVSEAVSPRVMKWFLEDLKKLKDSWKVTKESIQEMWKKHWVDQRVLDDVVTHVGNNPQIFNRGQTALTTTRKEAEAWQRMFTMGEEAATAAMKAINDKNPGMARRILTWMNNHKIKTWIGATLIATLAAAIGYEPSEEEPNVAWDLSTTNANTYFDPLTGEWNEPNMSIDPTMWEMPQWQWGEQFDSTPVWDFKIESVKLPDGKLPYQVIADELWMNWNDVRDKLDAVIESNLELAWVNLNDFGPKRSWPRNIVIANIVAQLAKNDPQWLDNLRSELAEINV